MIPMLIQAQRNQFSSVKIYGIENDQISINYTKPIISQISRNLIVWNGDITNSYTYKDLGITTPITFVTGEIIPRE
jgi:hypothetical protein